MALIGWKREQNPRELSNFQFFAKPTSSLADTKTEYSSASSSWPSSTEHPHFLCPQAALLQLSVLWYGCVTFFKKCRAWNEIIRGFWILTSRYPNSLLARVITYLWSAILFTYYFFSKTFFSKKCRTLLSEGAATHLRQITLTFAPTIIKLLQICSCNN